jgi:hypothetical protein
VRIIIDWSRVPAGVQSRRLLIGSNVAAKNPYPGGVNISVDNSGSSPPDARGPGLILVGVVNGVVVSTDRLVIEGTASDEGRGGSGVRQVTVNGGRASGDTAEGSDVAEWTATVSLVPGPNTVTVVATDDSPNANVTMATITVTYRAPLVLTDDPLAAGATPVRALHISELRATISELRKRDGLSSLTWTDDPLVPGVTPVKAAHVVELRDALLTVYLARGKPAPGYSRPALAPGSTVVRAADVAELRSAIAAVW